MRDQKITERIIKGTDRYFESSLDVRFHIMNMIPKVGKQISCVHVALKFACSKFTKADRVISVS